MGQRVVTNCIVHHLSFSWVLFLFFCYIPFHYSYYYNIFILSVIFYFTLVIKQFLSQPIRLGVLFFDSPPHPTGRGEGVSGCVVLSCWLGLNHDSPFGAQRGA